MSISSLCDLNGHNNVFLNKINYKTNSSDVGNVCFLYLDQPSQTIVNDDQPHNLGPWSKYFETSNNVVINADNTFSVLSRGFYQIDVSQCLNSVLNPAPSSLITVDVFNQSANGVLLKAVYRNSNLNDTYTVNGFYGLLPNTKYSIRVTLQNFTSGGNLTTLNEVMAGFSNYVCIHKIAQ